MSFDIHDIHIKNFITLKDVIIPLYDQGIVWIRGGNGVGKTVLIDAISWLLSGETSRDILSDHVIGGFGKSTKVSGNISIDGKKITLERYRKDKFYSNSFRILDAVDTSHRKTKETEERFEERLGCSWNLMRMSCFQYSKEDMNFSRMKSQERAKILDEIVGASDSNIPERYRKVNKMVRDIEKEIEDINNHAMYEKATLNQLEEDIKVGYSQLAFASANFEQQKYDLLNSPDRFSQKRLDEIGKNFTKEKEEYKKLTQMAVNNDEVERKISGYQEIINKYSALIFHNDKRIKEKEAYFNTTRRVGIICDQCGNLITDDSISILDKRINADINKLKNEKFEYEKSNNNTEKYITAEREKIYPNVDSKLAESKYKLAQLRNKYDEEQKKKEELQKQNEKLQQLKNNYELNIKTMRDQLDKKEKRINEIKNNDSENFFKIWKLKYKLESLNVLSEFYSPAGFRPLVMEHFSPVLSEFSNTYFKEFIDGEINIISKTSLADGRTVDKVNIEVSQEGKIKRFPGEWSLGQGGCVDFSLNSAIMKLANMKAGKEFSIKILDEFSNGMSGEWTNKLIEVLREKFMKKNMTILLTSHYPLDEKLFDQVWDLDLVENETKINFN